MSGQMGQAAGKRDTACEDTILSPARTADMERMAKIAAGDRVAMRALFDEFSRPLSAFVTRWLQNPHDASDVVNEVMIDVWRRADRFEGRAALKSWIFTIARNKAVDANRKNGRMVYTDDVPETVDASASAVEVVAAGEDAKVLAGCMGTLSDAHRRAVHLAFYEDMSYAEIARIEGCPVGTVKTRVLHAKKLLARCVSCKGRNVPG